MVKDFAELEEVMDSIDPQAFSGFELIFSVSREKVKEFRKRLEETRWYEVDWEYASDTEMELTLHVDADTE